jgi:hypothetical protein
MPINYFWKFRVAAHRLSRWADGGEEFPIKFQNLSETEKALIYNALNTVCDELENYGPNMGMYTGVAKVVANPEMKAPKVD